MGTQGQQSPPLRLPCAYHGFVPSSAASAPFSGPESLLAEVLNLGTADP